MYIIKYLFLIPASLPVLLQVISRQTNPMWSQMASPLTQSYHAHAASMPPRGPHCIYCPLGSVKVTETQLLPISLKAAAKQVKYLGKRESCFKHHGTIYTQEAYERIHLRSGFAGLKYNATAATVTHEVGMDSRHCQSFIQMGSMPLNRSAKPHQQNTLQAHPWAERFYWPCCDNSPPSKIRSQARSRL